MRVLILVSIVAFMAGPAGAAVGLSDETSKTVRIEGAPSVGLNKTAGVRGLTNSSLGLQPQEFKGLLDSDRFSIQHSVGMTYQSGYSSGMNQYYLGTIIYKAAEPLTIRARIGVANNLFGSPVGGHGASSTQLIVPDVSVLYQPRDNLRIEFRFMQQAGPGYYRGDYGY